MSDIEIKTERPAYVTFERRAVQDMVASEREGRYIAKDVDFVKITPAYTKDVIIHKVSDWFPKLKQDLANERISSTWVDNYRRHYEAWKNGQEIPLEGTPIRGWGVLSPAQQETLIKMQILTVEDLAGVNEDGLRRIGMGSVDMKNRATAFIKGAKDTGTLVMENSRLKAQLSVAIQNVDALTKSVEDLTAVVNRLDKANAPRETLTVVSEPEIALDDIIEDEEPAPKPRRSAKS